MMEKTCVICNSIFSTRSKKAKYCSSKCGKKARLLREKKYDSLYGFDLDTEEPEIRENHLVELNEKALSLGLTYGKYMGIEYAKEHPILRTW